MMNRKIPRPMELELKKRLDDQDIKMEILNKTMNQVLELLKGSSMMNTPGLIKTFQEFQVTLTESGKKMDYFERWWEIQKMKKGTFTFRTANLLTRTLAILGGLGVGVSIMLGILQLVDWLNK